MRTPVPQLALALTLALLPAIAARASGSAATPAYKSGPSAAAVTASRPALNPAWSVVFSCCAAAGLVLRHRALYRRK